MGSRITAALTLAAALVASTPAHAYEVKHAEGGTLVRWRRESVAWTVARSVGEVPDGVEAVAAATRAWTGQASAPKLEVGDGKDALEPGLDGTNAVFFAPDGYAAAAGALAVTILSYDDATGEILDADIVINGSYPIGRVEAGKATQTYDVGRILAHEMGHALGLSDELVVKDALMYPYVPRAQLLRAAPGNDDLAGLTTLYADADANLPADKPAGCGAVIARTGLASSPGGVTCAAGLLVAALLFKRSRRRGGRGAAACIALAAGVLVVPSPRMAHEPDEVVVTSSQTTSLRGVFRTDVELSAARCGAVPCATVSRFTMWGGRLGGVKQVIGGAHVPSAGDRVSRRSGP